MRLKFNENASNFCLVGLNLAVWVAAYSVKFAGAVGDFILKFEINFVNLDTEICVKFNKGKFDIVFKISFVK